MRTMIAGLFCGLMISGCAAGASERGDVLTPSSTAGASAGPNTCPVTVPPQPGFIPPEPYPPEPPSSFEAVWYGTPGLWTTLDPNGQVWRDLPVEMDGSVGDKTLWWSEDYSTAEGEDFGKADMTVTAVRLDGSAPKVVEGPGVGSFNPDIGNFMLVGLALPEPGCWQVTASYKGTELSYVMQVDSPTSTTPAEFSFEEAASLLAQREIFVTRIRSDQQAGLLGPDAFGTVLEEWMGHRPHWQVLSVHLGVVDVPNAHFNISNRLSYLVEITGPETGNCFYLFYATDGQEFLGACFYPTRSGSEVSPSPPITRASQPGNIKTLRRFFHAYNDGRLRDALSLFAEHASVSDCDYRNVRAIELTGRRQISLWLRQRFEDHDQLVVARIFNDNPDQPVGVAGVEYRRRTSDSLRRLGFARGIRPRLTTKVVFTEAHEILRFANGPWGVRVGSVARSLRNRRRPPRLQTKDSLGE